MLNCFKYFPWIKFQFYVIRLYTQCQKPPVERVRFGQLVLTYFMLILL